jgi:hypothetical protein
MAALAAASLLDCFRRKVAQHVARREQADQLLCLLVLSGQSIFAELRGKPDGSALLFQEQRRGKYTMAPHANPPAMNKDARESPLRHGRVEADRGADHG